MIQATIGMATDSGQRTGAWDEVYYTTHTDPLLALQAWTGQGNVQGAATPGSPIGLRQKALSNQCYIYYVRFGDPDNKTTKAIVWVPPMGKAVGSLLSDNMAGDCASMRVLDATGKQREVRIGGMPDTAVSGGIVDPGYINQYIGDIGAGTISPNANNFINAWRSIQGNIRTRVGAIGGATSWPITLFSKPTQYGPISVTLDLTNGNPSVNFTYAMSIRGQPQLRGSWRIAATAVAGIYNLLGSERVSAPAIARAFLTQRAFTSATPTVLKALFASALKLGKKKYQYVGRRSPILIRH